MLHFKNSYKSKMASGLESIELTEEGNWESFPDFAGAFVKQMGAVVIEKIASADCHIWKIKYDGAVLNLVYDDFPNGISIEPIDASGKQAIDKLYIRLKNQGVKSVVV